MITETLDAEITAIRQSIHDSIGWAMTKDTQQLYSALAQDADFFIFHPDSASTIVGFDAFRQLVEGFFMHPDFKATSFEVKELRITRARCGEVAWFSAMLDDFGEWQGRPTAWNDARWTGVLEQRDGRWVITQMHFSFAKD